MLSEVPGADDDAYADWVILERRLLPAHCLTPLSSLEGIFLITAWCVVRGGGGARKEERVKPEIWQRDTQSLW